MELTKQQMEELDKAYAEAPDQVNTSFKPLPEGHYAAKVEKIGISNHKGEPRVEIQLVITSGNYAGRKTWVNHTLSPEKARWIRNDFNMIGLSGDSLMKILTSEETLRSVYGTTVEVKMAYPKNAAAKRTTYPTIVKFLAAPDQRVDYVEKHDEDEVPF